MKQKFSKSLGLSTLALSALLVLGGCAGMSDRERNTAVGAGVGAVAGSVLTGGNVLGTVGGAVIGGAIVNESEKKK